MKLNFIINIKNITKDGSTAVMAMVYYNKKRYYLSTGHKVKPEEFDVDLGRIKKGVRGASLVNVSLDEIGVRYKTKVLEYEQVYGKNSCKDIKALLSDQLYKRESFVDYFKDKVSCSIKMAKKTKESYLQTAGYIHSFDPTRLLDEVDLNFVEKFYDYLIYVKKLKVNGASIAMRNLRAVCRMALKEEKIKQYPFEHFKIPREETHPKHLVESELEKLQQLYDQKTLSPKLQNTLKHFLRSCYCGLRISDIRRLNSDCFNDGYIILNMFKTKLPLRVPINKKILELMPEDFDFTKEQAIKQSNSRVADDINEVLKIAKINKKASFNTARHTFAVVSLQKGIPLEVLQTLMGHKNIATTQIYAKVVDSLKKKYMDLWDA